MFYNKITIHRCKRFGLNKTSTITITPKQKTVMILGRNGCGKSSFLDIGLSILPIDRRQFSKGGYREQEISFNNNEYYFYSAHNGDHIYKKNNEVLYEGKVASVYRELVQAEFGINQKIHEVLMAKPNRTFTAMSPMGERREWITRLSKSDFNYVLGFYDRVRKESRAIGNVIKHQTGRLSSETSKLMDTAELDGLKVRYERVQDTLQELYSTVGQETPTDMRKLSHHLETTFKELDEGSKWINKNSGYKPLPVPKSGIAITNYDDLMRYIASNEAVMERIMSQITELSSQEDSLSREHRDLLSKTDKNPEDLRKDIAKYKDEIDALLKKQTLDITLGTIPDSPQVHLECMRFIELLRTVSITIDLEESSSRNDTVRNINEHLAGIEGRLGRVTANIDHYESCQSVECPSCSHEFRPGISAATYEKDKVARVTLSEERDVLLDKLGEQREWFNIYREVRVVLSNVRDYQRSHSKLLPLWTLIEGVGGITEPSKALRIAMSYSNAIVDSQSYSKLIVSLAVCEDALAACVEGSQSGALEARITALHKQLEELRVEYASIDEDNRIATRSLRQRDEFRRQMERMHANYERLSRVVTAIFDNGDHHVVKQQIAAAQHELHSLKNTISGAEVQLGIVKDIQTQLDDLSIKELHYKVLEQRLSPSSGYIAELISRDIGALLDVMNQLISSVWSYPITLLNCTADNGDLNYRFPMVVGAHGNDVEDISMGSSSQADIINFAFRLLVHKAMEISNYPLIIDELERAFDGGHKESLHHVIQSLVKDDTWGQVFIISHNTDSMLSYSNAEFVVLDDHGLQLPVEYNQNVVIK